MDGPPRCVSQSVVAHGAVWVTCRWKETHVDIDEVSVAGPKHNIEISRQEVGTIQNILKTKHSELVALYIADNDDIQAPGAMPGENTSSLWNGIIVENNNAKTHHFEHTHKTGIIEWKPRDDFIISLRMFSIFTGCFRQR